MPIWELAPFLRAIWRRLSGVQHGLSYAALLGTPRQVKAEIPGGVQDCCLRMTKHC